jgi:hypothetical protein
MLDPVWSTAGILDRARPLLRRTPMIAPYESADHGVGDFQKPHHHANPIPEKKFGRYDMPSAVCCAGAQARLWGVGLSEAARRVCAPPPSPGVRRRTLRRR